MPVEKPFLSFANAWPFHSKTFLQDLTSVALFVSYAIRTRTLHLETILAHILNEILAVEFSVRLLLELNNLPFSKEGLDAQLTKKLIYVLIQAQAVN